MTCCNKSSLDACLKAIKLPPKLLLFYRLTDTQHCTYSLHSTFKSMTTKRTLLLPILPRSSFHSDQDPELSSLPIHITHTHAHTLVYPEDRLTLRVTSAKFVCDRTPSNSSFRHIRGNSFKRCEFITKAYCVQAVSNNVQSLSIFTQIFQNCDAIIVHV